MNGIINELLTSAIQHFLDNRPLSRIGRYLDGKIIDARVGLGDRPYNTRSGGSLMIIAEGENVAGLRSEIRFHRGDVIPNILIHTLEGADMNGELAVTYKGEPWTVKVEYENVSGWFTCESEVFDELVNVAMERSME